MSLELARTFEPPTFRDDRGGLCVLEKLDLPFDIKRFYWLFDIKNDKTRGEHAHKKLEQLMVCFGGAAIVTLDNGCVRREFNLNSPDKVLYVPAGLWRTIETSEDGAVLGVFASEVYDADDYIHNYDEYLKYASVATE